MRRYEERRDAKREGSLGIRQGDQERISQDELGSGMSMALTYAWLARESEVHKHLERFEDMRVRRYEGKERGDQPLSEQVLFQEIAPTW